MTDSSEQARFNMIQQQIRPWDVFDQRVLDIMMKIPREPFVPDAYRGLAYADVEVPLGSDQLMMAPRLVARMLQALDVRPEDRVLEIGTGSGYGTACLAALGRKVLSMELNAGLLAGAQEHLQQQGVRNVELREGDALAGPVQGGPFDVIVLSNVLEHISDRSQFLQKLQEAYLPGRILVRIPDYRRHWSVPLRKELGMTYFNDPTHKIEHTREEFEKEVALAGLSVFHVQVNWGELWAEVRGNGPNNSFDAGL